VRLRARSILKTRRIDNLMKQRAGRLSSRVALLTGASRGIGKSMALRFAEEGASVVINYLKNVDLADGVCEAIRAAGGQAICVAADIADPSQVNRMVGIVLERIGPIDILVNNAGIGILSPLLETSMADFDRMVAVNIKGIINCIQAVVPNMIEKRYGKVLNISSVAGFGNSFPGTSAYAATKSALVGLTKRLALEFGVHNITVNAIAPGRVRTDTALRVGILPEVEIRRIGEDLAKRTMLGRMGEPEDIANAALFLVSDEASFITAQTLTVDGGRTDLLSYSA
jgi:NAD(P)-dependent dehydrogenase (short-subunit alcohol dehydrogenase family)